MAPLQRMHWTTNEQWRIFQGYGEAPSLFIPGETMPFYEVTSDFSGNKNVGNLPGVPLTLWQGSLGTGNTINIDTPGAVYNNINFANRLIDVRENSTFNNCRFMLTQNDQGGQQDQVRLLNGNFTSVVFNDCEFHNRAQISKNGLFGRNFVVNRSVFTGHVDGVNNANTGGAPIVTAGEVNDCWIGDHAWWSTTGATGIVHPSDDQTHNDGSQTTVANMKWNNCFFFTWPSDYVGTGTPGSGSETNTYGGAYIYDQATMNSLRATHTLTSPRADQTFGGVTRVPLNGSFASIMGTLSSGTQLQHEVDHCYFSGGSVQINYSNSSLTGNAGHIHQCIFWNDMTLGHTNPTTNKGTAVYVKTGLTLDMPTSGSDPDANHWFDGTVASPSFA